MQLFVPFYEKESFAVKLCSCLWFQPSFSLTDRESKKYLKFFSKMIKPYNEADLDHEVS
jgi:hypothetical protein